MRSSALLVVVVVSCSVVVGSGCTPNPDGGPGGDGANEGEGEDDTGEGEGEGGVDGVEQEPNDGAQVDEVNELAIGDTVAGAIQAAGDVDIFHIATTPGLAWRVTLDVDDDSTLDGHVTVFDDGRGDDAPGADYVRLGRSPAGPGAILDFVAFGAGGHLVTVRDTRDVDGDGVGGATATYTLHVDELPLAPEPLSFPTDRVGALNDVSAVAVYEFDAVEGADFVVDLQADGDLDARLFVYAASEQDWVVRNDDRAVDDVDPLLDAFLPVGGPCLLIVESTGEAAGDLGYTIETSGNAP